MFQAFSVVFQNAIAKADPSENLYARVTNLVDFITFFVFMYTSRGLFECDKLIFMAQMSIQVHLLVRANKFIEMDPYPIPRLLSYHSTTHF